MIFEEKFELFSYNKFFNSETLNFYEKFIEQPMTHDSFAQRLNFALDKEGFPPKNRGRIQLLAEMVGLTHRGASKWINGETCPPAKKYPTLAKKLNVREAWLKDGQGAMCEEETPSTPNQDLLSNNNLVPVFQAEDFFSKTKSPLQMIVCDVVKVGELFAIQLETEAMSPRFPKGSIVIFDDKKPAQDGDFVLVNFDSYPTPIFRQLLCMGSSLYLNAHNPKFDRLLLTDHNKILGTLIQAVLSFT